jgi:hypothetical protein
LCYGCVVPYLLKVKEVLELVSGDTMLLEQVGNLFDLL